MTTNTTSPPLTPRPRTALPRPLLLAALIASLLTAVLGLTWALAPLVQLLGGPPERTPLELLLGVTGAAATLGIISLLGAITALAAIVRPVPRPALLAVAGAHVLVAGVGMGSLSTLSTAGYLLGLSMPLIVAMLVVQVIRRYPRARILVGGAAAVALLAGAVLLREVIVDLAVSMTPALLAELPMIAAVLLLVAVGAVWAGLAVTALRRDDAAERLTGWVTRHRLLFTLVAAACPLPYALVRLTWLTPWPLLAPFGMDPSTRLWGLVLSSGSWVAAVLTLGLVMRWGEVFPRWMPVVAGREVPVAAAAVPGGSMAALLTFAAVPMLVGAEEMSAVDRLLVAAAFPCWLWGPTLALAVWGYVGHRRAAVRDGSAAEVAGARQA